MRVTYRQIAKVLVRGLPLDDDEIASRVEDYVKDIEAMSDNQKLALKAGYIFASKVPKEEQADMFQELITAILENGTDSEALAYTIARNGWIDWIRKKETLKCHLAGSLNEVRTDQHGNEYELIDTIVGMDDLEDKVINRIEAQRLYRQLPRHIKLIVKKLRRGEKLLKKERDKIYDYRENHLRHKENKPQTVLSDAIKQILNNQAPLTSTERSTLFRYRRKYGDC